LSADLGIKNVNKIHGMTITIINDTENASYNN